LEFACDEMGYIRCASEEYPHDYSKEMKEIGDRISKIRTKIVKKIESIESKP